MEDALVRQYDKFLYRLGFVLLTLAGLGYMALGVSPDNSLFGAAFTFDANQNLLHLFFGLSAVATARWLNPSAQRVLTIIIGVLSFLVAIYSIYAYNAPSPNLLVMQVSLLWETLFYFVLGIWSMWLVLMPVGPMFVRDEAKR